MASKRVLIDTSILIDHLRRPQKDKTLFYQLTQNYDCLISAVTQFEFSIGSSSKNRDFSERLLKLLTVLPFDSACVQSAVAIYQALKARNQLISLPDIFIAATAISNKLPLQTLNRKHFERITNLKLQGRK